MHRYGLVHMWHLQTLKNKNRSVTKERRDDETLSPRNRNSTGQQSELPVSNLPITTKQDGSHDSRSTNSDNDYLDSCEILRARRAMEMARRRHEKAEVDLEEAEQRMKELSQTLAHLAGGDFRSVEECKAMIQELSQETQKLKDELASSERELNQKESQLNCAQQRKASL